MIRIEIEVSCPDAVQPVVFGARLVATLDVELANAGAVVHRVTVEEADA